MNVVPMRLKSGDCVIASIATAMQRSYEDVAKTLGVALDGAGIPVAESWPWPLDLDPVVTLTDICNRLHELGAFLVADLPPGFIEPIVIGGRLPAMLIVNSDYPADEGRSHALAYRDGRVIDCRTATEDDRRPLAAMLFFTSVNG